MGHKPKIIGVDMAAQPSVCFIAEYSRAPDGKIVIGDYREVPGKPTRAMRRRMIETREVIALNILGGE